MPVLPNSLSQRLTSSLAILQNRAEDALGSVVVAATTTVKTKKKAKLSKGGIAGVVIAAVIVLIIILAIIAFILIKKNKAKKLAAQQHENGNMIEAPQYAVNGVETNQGGMQNEQGVIGGSGGVKEVM